MASLIVYLLILFFVDITMCKDCVIDNRVLEISWEYKLLKDLFINYDSMINPTNCSETNFTVGVQFVFENYRFMSNEQVFQLHSWVFLSWYDYRLKWNPADYGGIDKITINSWNLWTPGLRLFNAADQDDNGFYDYDSFIFTSCLLKPNGLVQCLPRITHRTGCQTKLINWPYDSQKCTLHFGDWSMAGKKVIFTFNGTKPIQMIESEYGSGWTVVRFESKEDPNSTIQISLTFELEREALGLAVIIAVPSIIVCILTLTSLILDVADNVRIGVVYLSIVLHFSLILEISESIPRQGEDVPLVLLHVRGSLFLTIIVGILTFFLMFLKKRVVPPPLKVTSLVEYIHNGFMKYILLPKLETDEKRLEHSEDVDAHEKTMEEWSDFVNIVNSVCLIVFTIVYVCLFTFYMPRALHSTFSGNFY